MNRIATRGYGQTNRIPTWGYGGVFQGAIGDLLVKDKIQLKRVIEKIFTWDIYSPVSFISEIDFNIYTPLQLTNFKELSISARLLKENTETYEINSSVEFNNEFNLNFMTTLEHSKLIRILRII